MNITSGLSPLKRPEFWPSKQDDVFYDSVSVIPILLLGGSSSRVRRAKRELSAFLFL